PIARGRRTPRRFPEKRAQLACIGCRPVTTLATGWLYGLEEVAMRSLRWVSLIALAGALACSTAEDATAPRPLGAEALGAAGISDAHGQGRDRNEQTIVEFDALPVHGSSCPDPFQPPGTPPTLANPLTIQGVTFRDPDCLQSGFCSSPTCPVEKTLLTLNVGGTISLAAHNPGVVLPIEGMGDTPFVVQFNERRGRTANLDRGGPPLGAGFVGVSSEPGIALVSLARTGPTTDCQGPSCGPLPIARVIVMSR